MVCGDPSLYADEEVRKCNEFVLSYGNGYQIGLCVDLENRYVKQRTSKTTRYPYTPGLIAYIHNFIDCNQCRKKIGFMTLHRTLRCFQSTSVLWQDDFLHVIEKFLCRTSIRKYMCISKSIATKCNMKNSPRTVPLCFVLFQFNNGMRYKPSIGPYEYLEWKNIGGLSCDNVCHCLTLQPLRALLKSKTILLK